MYFLQVDEVGGGVTLKKQYLEESAIEVNNLSPDVGPFPEPPIYNTSSSEVSIESLRTTNTPAPNMWTLPTCCTCSMRIQDSSHGCCIL